MSRKSWTSKGKQCCIFGCNNFQGRCPPGTRFHSFPTLDLERSDVWAVRTGREKFIGKANRSARKHEVICSDHFSDEAYSCPTQRESSSLLSGPKGSLPTLNLPKHNHPVERKKSTYKGSTTAISTKEVNHNIAASSTSTGTSSTSGNDLISSSNDVSTGRGRPPLTVTQLKKKLQDVRQRLKRSEDSRRILQHEVLRLRKANTYSMKYKKMVTSRYSCRCSSFSKLSPTVRSLVLDQLVNAGRVTSGVRYSCGTYKLAAGILHYSPRTHRFLRGAGFVLPSKRSVRRRVGCCLRKSGPCPIGD